MMPSDYIGVYGASGFGKEVMPLLREQYPDFAKENCNKVGIDYIKKIKTHNFSSLQDYLDSMVSGLSHISEKREINRLLNNWNPEVRYSHLDLDYGQIKEFYAHTIQYLRKM